MRRTPLRSFIPLIAAATLVAGCTSSAAPKRTVTVVATVTSDSTTTGSASGSGITVVAPSSSAPGSGAKSSGAATSGATRTPSTSKPATSKPAPSKPVTSKPATPKPATSTAPLNTKIDPLKANCSALLNASDIKKFFGTDVPTATNRVRDVANPGRRMTGKTRCLYGVKGKDSKVVVALSLYADAAAATKQVGITHDYEVSQGAVATAGKVSGYPADILLRDGGLITVSYGKWTVAVAADKGVIVGGGDATKLTQAAAAVLTRVLKG